MTTEPTATSAANSYSTLEEIRLRKEQLSDSIERDSAQISAMWNELFVKREESSKGEYIATLVTNSITAIDAFLLVRKLMKRYGGIASLFTRGKSSGRKSRRR